VVTTATTSRAVLVNSQLSHVCARLTLSAKQSTKTLSAATLRNAMSRTSSPATMQKFASLDAVMSAITRSSQATSLVRSTGLRASALTVTTAFPLLARMTTTASTTAYTTANAPSPRLRTAKRAIAFSSPNFEKD